MGLVKLTLQVALPNDHPEAIEWFEDMEGDGTPHRLDPSPVLKREAKRAVTEYVNRVVKMYRFTQARRNKDA